MSQNWMCVTCYPSRLDVLIAPLVAFDEYGQRTEWAVVL